MLSLGIDIGTSGIRAVVMNKEQQILATADAELTPPLVLHAKKNNYTAYSQDPAHWWDTFKIVIARLSHELETKTQRQLSDITHLAIDGTSGTVLLADKNGLPCCKALMYNDQRAAKFAQVIAQYAPENTAAAGVTSGLAKLLWLYRYSGASKDTCYALNQSDWINGLLSGCFKQGHKGQSDYNNALKMGYDAEQRCWPDWLTAFLKQRNFPVQILPDVFPPGQVTGRVDPDMASYFGFSNELQICAGTTDSTAAIIASGARHCGEAITSLGSTLVMKVITDKPIYNHQWGVYSQPYNDCWLAGGASNSGGAVLKHLFSIKELSQLTDKLNLKISQHQFKSLDLNYYPLLSPGERFPIHDHKLEAKLSPRPAQDIEFFQALLEGMADIETLAYQRLLELGAPYPKHVKSIGGGSFNTAWQFIREQKLGRPVYLADYEQAAAGSAILAQSTWSQEKTDCTLD